MTICMDMWVNQLRNLVYADITMSLWHAENLQVCSQMQLIVYAPDVFVIVRAVLLMHTSQHLRCFLVG